MLRVTGEPRWMGSLFQNIPFSRVRLFDSTELNDIFAACRLSPSPPLTAPAGSTLLRTTPPSSTAHNHDHFPHGFCAFTSHRKQQHKLRCRAAHRVVSLLCSFCNRAIFVGNPTAFLNKVGEPPTRMKNERDDVILYWF